MEPGRPLGDAAWLASQRWFRSKQRTIETVTEVDTAAIGRRGQLTIVEVGYRDGGRSDCYLVPRVGEREPADGDGVWRELAEVMNRGGELAGERGRFVAAPRSDPAPLAELDERQLRVEQSNTSVVLGERLILKLYRLLEQGEKPDIDVGAFLTQAGFADTPAVCGVLEYVDTEGARSAAAMLQTFVACRGDAWTTMLDALAAGGEHATDLAAQLGRLTRRLHATLTSHPDDPRFPARLATAGEAAEWRASAARQFREALAAVGDDDRGRLVALAPAVEERFDDAFAGAAGRAAVSRIHGDYHLGQLLARIDGGFSVIDFEGEPARPLAERSKPTSPLRDVAGMLRSFDYAARTAGAPDGWLDAARAAFVHSYGGVDADLRPLLDAFELEKACYEIAYEANNRPAWIGLPLAAVERLAAR